MKKAIWLKSPVETGAAAITFSGSVSVKKEVLRATLSATSIGVYTASVNGKRVGNRVLTPGYTSYNNRVMFQTYDVTELITDKTTVSITVAPGWAVGHIGFSGREKLYHPHVLAAFELEVCYTDGTSELFVADESFTVSTSEVTFADIYDGETLDKTAPIVTLGNAVIEDAPFTAVPDNGAPITEHESLSPIAYIVTPNGEKVIDFGQNMTGYVTLRIKGKRGERVSFTHAEVLDSDGNFYNANYRKAKNVITYVLDGEEHVYKPEYSFQGFRYIRLDEYPEGEVDLNGFRAVAVHTQMTRTADFTTGNAKINQLYHNIIWGQKSNYLDVPTDCPQRNERLGWTGDTQVFCRAAAINYDVRRFFKKWLTDLRLEQGEDGRVMGTCPEIYGSCSPISRISAGWGDAATIVPWTLYELYGDKQILEDNFELMRGWVEYMHSAGSEEYLWLGGFHYGDWLAMDAGADSYVGATANDLVATAFFAYSTSLLIKAGEVLGKDMSYYRDMHTKVVAAFREYFMENGMPKDEFPLTEILPDSKKSSSDTVRRGVTQTALVLILQFGLCTEQERPALINKLVELIDEFGGRMSTGFLGTPYILHALSDNGRTDVAYKLFFNEDNPSWLYSVNHGATTIWEHWNGIKEDGSFWSTSMNSFNHYAYGAVADWMFGVIAGIKVTAPAYKEVIVAPMPSEKLGFARAEIDTVSGRIESSWYYTADSVRFEITVPDGTVAKIVLPNGYTETVRGGKYCYGISKNI